MRAGDFAPEDSHFLVGAAVDYAADTFNILSYLPGRRSPLCALKKQMLGEVGEGTLRSAHELMQTARQMVKGK